MIIAEMCYALKDNIHPNLNQLEIPRVAILSPSLCGSDGKSDFDFNDGTGC